jgi:hypothetical protein
VAVALRGFKDPSGRVDWHGFPLGLLCIESRSTWK